MHANHKSLLHFQTQTPPTQFNSIQTSTKSNQRVPNQLPDQSKGVPDIDGPVHKSSSDEAERELLGGGSCRGPPPWKAVEALGARCLASERQFPIFGLEIELEDLEARWRAERPAIVPAATYGASGASATDADLLTPFIHAICPYPQIQIQIRVFISLYIYMICINTESGSEGNCKFEPELRS